ncbi:hypothetical protein JQ581_01505 [Bradyrhizobium liaoningense]|uniref:hypothetical protein n=1 Tax=Bradyrhizobium liaoningense TaxID=43992 RepID=UPI001BAD0248|nr:hypothetical protein [Bradyrhizobium liaoningense]MBR0735590.1 hypothetical protein [Bradyrhizobium liaoningense]
MKLSEGPVPESDRVSEQPWRLVRHLDPMQRIAIIAFMFALAVMLARWVGNGDVQTAKHSEPDKTATVGQAH